MIKTIQKMLMLSLCAVSPSIIGAATLSVDEAKDVAAEFFQSGEVHRLADKDAFILAYTASDEASNPICYVFNAKDGKGFVIISADENSIPVIGYSDKSIWSVGSVSNSAERVLFEPVKVSNEVRHRVLAQASAKSDSKLLETPSWSQESPFNNSIPNRRLTGCVGVALAEILKYHNYPESRPGSLINNGENSRYQWNSIRMDNYRSGYTEGEAEAVATLVADAAIGIGTDFGMSSSSAYEVKVPYALTSLFGYDAGVSYKKRQEMTRDAWDQVIIDEIDNNRPVLYCGQDISSGHAFVCDGYEMRGSIPYFHINWGWGGSANGFFATDALNPVVSKAHSYNDLMTIVYNIKPATDNTSWSDLHITSDSRQVGLTLDVSDITTVPSFTVRAGALKNISNSDFSGKVSVALFGSDGKMKSLLNDGRNINLMALQIMNYVDLLCSVPSGVTVADGDVVRLVAQPSFSTEWLPVAGDILAPGEATAKGYDIPYLSVSLPVSSEDAEVSASSNRIVSGRDYTFTVIPKSTDKVITVKANGFILTGDASNCYRLSNVLEDQKIDILVQNASEVLSKGTLWVTAGNLQNLLSEQEAATITDLTLFGTINVNDFNFMRDRMKLERLDISQVSIAASGSNPANAIPTKAFTNYRSLKQIILPANLTTFKNGCLAQTGLTSIEIPASVGTWEYNVFVGCNSLREVIVRRSSPAWINWCVFNGTPMAKLVVPVGATAAYQAKEYWQDFKEIVEENPVAADRFTLKVSELKGVKFTPLTEGTEFQKGEKYNFMVETDGTHGDATMQVYANSTRLAADASGVYSATINGNTLIHTEFIQPQATTIDKTWKLTGDAGGIGLVTEVVNVPFNRSFVVRANAIKVPEGDDAAKFYGIVLTDKNGGIKEFISSIVSNYYNSNAQNICYNFYCQVKEAEVKEGNQIRLATSYNKKDWQLVEGESGSITDRLEAIGNPVVYHNVVMPSSVTGARIEGSTSQVVRGMPFTVKASAVNPSQRVSVAINGEPKMTNVANANVSIPAVLEDLDITITVKDAESGDYMVYNIQEGLLASKLADCPTRVKLIGNMLLSDFEAIRANASVIIDLDMSDVTIKGAAMTGNSIPENAFAPKSATAVSSLKTIILPNNLERINQNAFARCTQISEITIPANVSYIGDGAFSACVGLTKLIAKPKVAPTCGNMSPFPSNASKISLEVPKGSEDSYSVASTWWSTLSLYKAPVEAKDIYWVKVDGSRALVDSYKGNLNRVEVGEADVEFKLLLPNYQQPSSKNNSYIRPGVAFKLYDNGVDVFNNLNSYHYEPYQYYRIYPEQIVNMTGGQLALRWVHSATSGPWMPQNHEIDIQFYYSINFEYKEGAEGVQAQIVEKPEGCEWINVPMSYFEYMVKNDKGQNVVNTEVKPVLYKEGSEIKFQLSDIPDKTSIVVSLMTRVMTKTGSAPEYEEREITLEANNGIYTIPALQGDSWIRISGIRSYEEGDVIPAEYLEVIDKEDAFTFTELSVSGEMSEEEFEKIRDNFESVETIDLTAIDNEAIPEGAFEGMKQLKDVILPETVTEIGAGAFKDCDSIESLTLPGVISIGEGAFEGCSNLTSILLPSLGSTEVSGKPGMRKVTNEFDVTSESFKGLNPNCLIYVGTAEIPNSESLNIIRNVGGTRVADSDINLDGNHPFNAPASFMLGDHNISFTVEITASEDCGVDGGWKTIILPFQPSEMKVEAEFGERNGSGIHIKSFDGPDALELTEQTAIIPNRPYLANVCAPFASVPVTFTAHARNHEGEETIYDVPFTPVPEELVAEGKEFSLYGSYDGQTRPVVCYTLNEEATKFICPEVDENVVVTPFTAYIVANEGTDKKELEIGSHPLWVFEPESTVVAGTKLHRSDKIDIASKTKNASVYYTVDNSDPRNSESRQLYKDPFEMDGPSMSIKAVAEYNGNSSEVVELNFELKKAEVDFNLGNGWHWISHNAENAVAVSDFAIEKGISAILSQTEEVVCDPTYGFVGSLRELAPVNGYKLQIDVDGDNWQGKVSDIAFDPHVATIKLNKGWNWIGTPIDEGSLLIDDLFSSLNVEEGDELVGLDGFVQADADGVWKGTLTHMIPGTGYMFYSNSEKEFGYSIIAAHDTEMPVKAPVTSKDGYWTVDNHKYASVMPVIADLDAVGDLEDYTVAAFCGNECRGIGAVVDGTVMINIHGNAGDVINFRFLGSDEKEMVSSTSLVFCDKPEGTFVNPLRISVSDASAVSTIESGLDGMSYNEGSFIFNGDLSDVKSIEIYDLTGKMIAKTNGEHVIKVGNIDGSVVTLVIRKSGSSHTYKVMVK